MVLAKARGLCKQPSPARGAGDHPLPAGVGCFGQDCLAPEPVSGAQELQRYRSMTVEELRLQWLQFVTEVRFVLPCSLAPKPAWGGATAAAP